MPFCPNCGAKLSEDSKFCPTCGTQVTFTEPVDKNTENVQEEKIPIVNDDKNDEVDAESTNTKNELKRILKPAFKSAIIATILSVIYSLFLSAPLTGEKGSWKMTFGDLSFNLYDDADFLYGWMSFSGSKVRWATVDEGIMSPHTGSYKCTGSEKTYKLRVKEDGEIFYKVLLTFDGTEGGPNTYLKFRDKKGTSGVMESDSWDGVSADPAINNTYSDNSTSNKDIYYTEDDNEYTEEYDPDVPEEYDFSLDPNTETYSDTSLPNMAVRYFDFLTRGYKAEMYRENMMSPDVAGKSTKDVGMYYCDLDGDDNEELIICDMSQLEHVYAVYKGDSFSDSTRFSSADKLLAYAGLDPSVKQSGEFKSNQNRMSKRGSPYLRRAIWLASTVAVHRDPMFQTYNEKKLSEGLHYMNVIGHVSRKMTAVIFAVLRDGQPYQPILQSAG